MSKPTQAVVIGASMAGLLAACALSETFDRVVLVERDRLPCDASDRRGVPQGKHLHALLAGGLVALNKLFPGFENDLAAAGAVRSDVQSDIHWWVEAHLIKPEPSGIIGFSCSRRLLEHTVRERVKALPGVEIIDHWDVLGLVRVDDGRAVGGVWIVSRDNNSEPSELPADLVVDATGRASRSSQWLTELGYQAAEETRIPVDVTYVTRTYRREPGQLDGRAGTCTGSDPDLPIGAFLLALEDDTFMLTAGGIYGETRAWRTSHTSFTLRHFSSTSATRSSVSSVNPLRGGLSMAIRSLPAGRSRRSMPMSHPTMPRERLTACNHLVTPWSRSGSQRRRGAIPRHLCDLR